MNLFPWKRRERELEKQRADARLRRTQVASDWKNLSKQTKAVREEVEMNDWTNTIKTIFSGG